jgi:hypothetical protein
MHAENIPRAKPYARRVAEVLAAWFAALFMGVCVTLSVGFGPDLELLAATMGGPLTWMVVFIQPVYFSPYWFFLGSIAVFMLFQVFPRPLFWCLGWSLIGLAFPIWAVAVGAFS